MVAEVVGGLLCATGGLMTYGVRGRSSTVFGPSVYRGSAGRPAIALTFDDGPSESTVQLLKILERNRVPATFFQCGVHVRRLPEVAKQVFRAGHEIGNHTDTHPRLYLRSAAFIHEELARAQQIILETTGAAPSLFRAPYGARWFGLRSAQRRLRLTGVMWTAIGLDWKKPAAWIVEHLVRKADNGAIFCLHDGREAERDPDIGETLEAVRRLVPALLEQGYQFETVSQILCPTN